VFVALNVGTVPVTKLLLASLRMMVIVEVATPFAITGPVPLIDEFVARAIPAVKTTVPPVFRTGLVILKVFVSAFVDEKVQTDTPPASLIEHKS
jgi:hypothetical protein